MAEVTPMRGKRVKKARCQVEGHGECEVTRFADAYDRRGEDRQFRSDVGDELVELENEAEPWFSERWPWIEEKHTLGRALDWEWRTGQYAEIADCLRYGQPLPDPEDRP